LLGFASPGITGRTEDHFRQVKLLFNGAYNWQYGDFRPFATAGAGVYFVRLLFDGATDPPRETRGGINLGGGTEFLLNSESAIKAELRFDIVSDPIGALSPDATGVTLTVGYKRYF
jgi:opacity protein-like surface antigen